MIDALDDLLQRAHEARARERDFAAFAAHELKTPLAGLKAQAQVARRAPDEATRNRALSRIQHSVDVSDRMVRQLLDLTRIETTTPTAHTPGDVDGVARLVAERLASRAQARDIRFQIASDGPAASLAETENFRTALHNVVENALSAAPAGSIVTLTSGPSGVRVTDQGPGIPDIDLARITDRFYRGSHPQGEGSGLAIGKAALARLGGDIDFTKQPDGGQVVTLSVKSTKPT